MCRSASPLLGSFVSVRAVAHTVSHLPEMVADGSGEKSRTDTEKDSGEKQK